MKHLLATIALAILTYPYSNLQAQNNWCGHDDMQQQLLQQDSQYALEMEQLNTLLNAPVPESQRGTVRIIPVVFHVVYATQADNISVAQIKDGLRVLNEDFRLLNSDANTIRNIFTSRAADIEIEFRLATKDPQGNCTDGITRTQSNESLTGDNDVKNVISWDNSRYYNIWVTRHVLGTTRASGRTVLGYSYFPRQGSQSFRRDGTVIRHDELGTIGTAVADGRTLTHETGHYLALYHPFQAQQGSSNGCIGQGDLVADTPPVQIENFGCNYNTNSCTADNFPDMIENHMDYSSCAVMFTNGQKTRMTNVVTNSSLRGGMVSNGNLNFTGVNNPLTCAPQAKFSAERRVICKGETIQFTDESEEGQATAWNWTVNGASTPNASVQNPTFTFNQAGVYDVSLQVSNSAGSNTGTQTDFIYVKQDSAGAFNKLWTESFEAASIPDKVTPLDVGGDGRTFELYTAGGSHLAQSLLLRNNPLYPGEIDELITPALKTKGASSDLALYFDLAFAARDNSNSDLLEVYVSRDCGQNWNRRRFYRGSRLRTAPNTQSSFVPNAQQWVTESINFSAYIQDEPILIKFVFENGGGNNFFIDNIRFGESPDVSLADQEFRSRVKVYPNPSKGNFELTLEGAKDTHLMLHITDLSGNLVMRKSLELNNGGLQTILNTSLPQGFYILSLTGKSTDYSQKLIIQK
jgi:hypothetical protein